MNLRLRRSHQRRIDYGLTFTSEHGSRVLKDLYRFCGMAQPSFVPGAPDETAFNEGKRRVFLRIAALLELNENQVRQMIADHEGDI